MDLALTASQKKLVATGTGGVTTQNLVSALDIVNFLVQDFRYEMTTMHYTPMCIMTALPTSIRRTTPPYTMAAATL